MIRQHLYLICPDEYVSEDGTNVRLPIRNDLDYMTLAAFGQFSQYFDSDGQTQESKTCVVRIGQTKGKSALHLYFPELPWAPIWSNFIADLCFQADLSEDELWLPENRTALHAALCLSSDVIICTSLDEVRASAPEFDGTVTIPASVDVPEATKDILIDSRVFV